MPTKVPVTQVRAGLDRAVAQEGVEVLAVDHADEAVVDRDVDVARGGRDHAGAGDPGDDLVVGDGEVGDQPRRDRAAAGLDAAGPVEQRHRVAGAAPGRAAAVAPDGPPPTTTTS